MKRSHAPSVVDAAKRQRDEEASTAAAAAAALAEQPEAPSIGRTLRHREDRAAADAKPSGPTRDYIDITGKQAKKRGRPGKKEEEEEEPVLPDDDDGEVPNKESKVTEDTPMSEFSANTDKESTLEDGDLVADGRPPKRKASEIDAAYFQVIYHQVNTRRERETHDGTNFRVAPPALTSQVFFVSAARGPLCSTSKPDEK